jgi:hypothetical protein
MRFRSELLNPPRGGTDVAIDRIYDVYITPKGQVEGESQDIGDILEESDAVLGKFGKAD